MRFILYHQAETTTELERRELKDATATAILATCKRPTRAAFAEHRSPFNPDVPAIEQQEALFKLLGKFSAVTPDDMKSIAAFLTRDWTSAAAAHALVDTLFAALFDTTAIHTASLTWTRSHRRVISAPKALRCCKPSWTACPCSSSPRQNQSS